MSCLSSPYGVKIILYLLGDTSLLNQHEEEILAYPSPLR